MFKCLLYHSLLRILQCECAFAFFPAKFRLNLSSTHRRCCRRTWGSSRCGRSWRRRGTRPRKTRPGSGAASRWGARSGRHAERSPSCSSTEICGELQRIAIYQCSSIVTLLCIVHQHTIYVLNTHLSCNWSEGYFCGQFIRNIC